MQVTQSAPVWAEKLLLRATEVAILKEAPRMLWALDTQAVMRLNARW